MFNGEYIKSVYYGGLDGVCTNLIIVVSGFSNGSAPTIILALGLSLMLGEALGMGAGDYLGTKADEEFLAHEENRERQEIENDFEVEK